MAQVKLSIPIGELFSFLGIDNDLYNVIQQTDRNIDIKSPSGKYVQIHAFIKKRGTVSKYNFATGNIICDKNHLVKQKNGEFKFIKNAEHLLLNQMPTEILNSQILGYKDVYDISIDYPHEYVTSSGIICHNTTLSLILVKNINCEYLYINASSENSVDDVRTKITGFASSVGFKDLKIVILDEAEYLSPNAQAALRNVMETFSMHTRFILTCNYIERIIEPIISRTQVYELIPPSKKEVASHVFNILRKENIEAQPIDLKFILDSMYPDIRRIINTLQMQSVNGKLVIDQKSMVDSDYKLKVIEILKDTKKEKKDAFKEIRQLITDNSISDFSDIYTLLYDTIDDYAKGHIAQVILILAEMEYKSSFVVDKEISFMSTIIQLLNEIKTK
jgi:replication factor C small subunit